LGAGGARAVFNVGMYLLMLDEDLAYFTDDLVSAVGCRRRAFRVLPASLREVI
jgi:hypothetical protein